MYSERIGNLSKSGGGGLKNVAGGPSVANINSINEAAKNAEAGNNYVVVDGKTQHSNEFPYIPFARDDYDDVANIKRQFQVGGAQAVVTLDKDDANYALRQRAQVENADFDRWVMEKYDLTDPAQNFMMQQIAPDQFQRRLDLIEAQQSLVSKYARLRLMGPKKLDDLKFEWLVETGRIELPRGPIWNPQEWMSQQLGWDGRDRNARGKLNRQRFRAGLFSPLNYLAEGYTGRVANEDNPADITGGVDLLDDQYFAGSKARNPYSNWGQNPIRGSSQVPYAADINGLMPGAIFYRDIAAVPAVRADPVAGIVGAPKQKARREKMGNFFPAGIDPGAAARYNAMD